MYGVDECKEAEDPYRLVMIRHGRHVLFFSPSLFRRCLFEPFRLFFFLSKIKNNSAPRTWWTFSCEEIGRRIGKYRKPFILWQMESYFGSQRTFNVILSSGRRDGGNYSGQSNKHARASYRCIHLLQQEKMPGSFQGPKWIGVCHSAGRDDLRFFFFSPSIKKVTRRPTSIGNRANPINERMFQTDFGISHRHHIEATRRKRTNLLVVPVAGPRLYCGITWLASESV